MAEQKDSGAGVCEVPIEGEFTIYTALERKNALLEKLEGCAELELDLAEVGEIDTAGIQVLLVLKREAERQGRGLRLVNHSQAVFEVLDLLNLQAHFGDPMVISANWKAS
jgi:anti-anti-sigma factor